MRRYSVCVHRLAAALDVNVRDILGRDLPAARWKRRKPRRRPAELPAVPRRRAA